MTAGLMISTLGAIAIAPILRGAPPVEPSPPEGDPAVERQPELSTCPQPEIHVAPATCPDPESWAAPHSCPACPTVATAEPETADPDTEPTAEWPDTQGPPVERYATTLIPHGDWVGVGSRIGLVETDAGMVMVHAERGVLGLVQPPERAVWTGVDRTDQLWAADEEGGLWSSADGVNFRKVDQVAGATLWDLNGRQVVAAAGDRLIVLSGDRRAESVPKPGATWVFVGSQGAGVAAAQADDGAVFVTADGGSSWESSDSTATLVRSGAWIRGSERDDASLTADGQWSRDLSWWQARLGYGSFREKASLHEGRVYYRWDAPLATWNDPPPATRGAHYDDGEPVASLSATVGFKRDRSCRGVSCLHYTWTHALPNSPARFGFFRNGTCDSDDYRCAAGDATVDTPTLGILDTRTGEVRVTTTPASCHTPRNVRTVAGAGLVVCDRDAETDLWMVDTNGTWFFEATLERPASDLTLHWGSTPAFRGSITPSVGADGTLLLHIGRPCAQDVPAVVRAPLPLGSEGAWRTVEAEGARTWRVGEDGIVYGFTQPDRSDPHGLRVVASRPEGAVVTVEELRVEDDLTDAHVEGNRVALETARSRAHTWRLVDGVDLTEDFEMDIPPNNHGAGVECQR